MLNTDTIAHNRYVTYGDYTFEVISGPDEYGDLKVKIRNTKDSSFFCFQEYNDVDAIKKLCYSDLSTSAIMNASQRTIMVHKASGLIIYHKFDDAKKPISTITAVGMPLGSNVLPGDLAEKRVPEKGEVKIFESASNFFNIY